VFGLLAAYFNQDFTHDYTTLEDAVSAYAEGTGHLIRQQARAEIRRIRSIPMADPERFLALRWLGLEIDPRAEGYLTTDDWLGWLDIQLSLTLTDIRLDPAE
jgi:hypothetical protein